MKSALNRPVTPDEVKRWFGKARQAQLDEKRYGAIAAAITRLAWPGDPPPPLDAPWLVKETLDPDTDPWWDSKAVAKAAKLVLTSLPAMRRHWNSLGLSPETRGGSEAVNALSATLEAAMPYIEFPFGEYKRVIGSKPRNAWHLPSIIVARIVIKEMFPNGNPSPAISRNSIVARVVTKALLRMRIQKALGQEAVSMHLTRWDKKYGLTPKGINSLTTEQASALRPLSD